MKAGSHVDLQSTPETSTGRRVDRRSSCHRRYQKQIGVDRVPYLHADALVDCQSAARAGASVTSCLHLAGRLDVVFQVCSYGRNWLFEPASLDTVIISEARRQHVADAVMRVVERMPSGERRLADEDADPWVVISRAYSPER